MSNAILAQLSSDSYASALGMTVQSPSPVLALCRQLVASSTYASSSRFSREAITSPSRTCYRRG